MGSRLAILMKSSQSISQNNYFFLTGIGAGFKVCADAFTVAIAATPTKIPAMMISIMSPWESHLIYRHF
jgi:hypothetical protein